MLLFLVKLIRLESTLLSPLDMWASTFVLGLVCQKNILHEYLISTADSAWSKNIVFFIAHLMDCYPQSRMLGLPGSE